jgi:exosortase/archaeosortase family protein
MRSHKLAKSIFSSAELKKGLHFLIGIGCFYTLFYIIISSIDLYVLKAFSASAAHALLGVFGVPAQLILQGLAEPTILVGNVIAQINNLCAGDIEIALLFAIVLETWDRTWRQRIWGCIFGFLLIMIINPLRIAIVLAAGHYASWSTADLAHDLLFRVSLIIIIVLYYYVWYVHYETITKKIRKIVRRGKK